MDPIRIYPKEAFRRSECVAKSTSGNFPNTSDFTDPDSPLVRFPNPLASGSWGTWQLDSLTLNHSKSTPIQSLDSKPLQNMNKMWGMNLMLSGCSRNTWCWWYIGSDILGRVNWLRNINPGILARVCERNIWQDSQWRALSHECSHSQEPIFPPLGCNYCALSSHRLPSQSPLFVFCFVIHRAALQ